MTFLNFRPPMFVAALGVITLILTMQTGLALYVNYLQLEKDLRNELFREEISDSMKSQNILEYLLQKQEFEQVQEEVSVMGIEPAISKAVVIDENRIVRASTAYVDRGRTFENLFPDLADSGYEILMEEARKAQQYRALLLEEMDCWVLFQPVSFALSDDISHRHRIGFLVKKVDLLWVKQQARSGLLGRFLPTLLPLLLGAAFFAVLAYILHIRRLKTLAQLVRDISLKGSNAGDTDDFENGAGVFQFLTRRSDTFLEKQQQELTAAVEQIAFREQGLSLMLDSIGDAVIATDTDARIIRMNPIAENLTAWNFADAEGKALEEILPIVDSLTREPLVNPVAEVLSTGRVVNLSSNTILLARDGSEYHIADSAAPIENEDGTILGVILVFRDNTEYYHLQNMLFERNQLLEAVMDNMPPLLYIKNLNGEFVDVNRAFEGAFNMKNEELLGATDRDLFDKDMADQYAAEDQRVIGSRQTISFQNEAKTINGNRNYLTTKFPLYDLNDQIYAVCGMSMDITEQMRLFTQLEHSKKNLQSIIDHAPAVIYTRDLQGRFLLANENVSKLLQLPLNKIIGANSYDVMDSENADQHLLHEKLVVESGASQEFIEQFDQEDGVHHFLSVKYPLFDEHNEIYAVGGISTDITERFQLEQSVRISEQHMRLYREQNPLALIEWNPKLEVLDWNPAAEKLFGYSKEEAMGRGANELIVPEHLREYVDELRDALVTKSGGEASINQNVTKTGQLIYCQWQNTPITNDSGAVIGIASLINDITDKQRIETELKAQEVELHSILNHIADGVITIDEVGTVLTFNHSAEILFGYDLDEVKGNNLTMLMPEPTRSQHRSFLLRYLETGEAKVIGFNRVVTAIRKNGEAFSMRLSVAELPVSALGKRRFVGSCMDVTELEQRELQLRQVQKMEALGKLTGGIAHDYNNMLGVILGYVDLLEGKLKEPNLIRYVAQIQKAGQRGASLTDKLLSFSRSKAIEPEVVDINQLLKEERDMLEKTLTPRIALVLDLEVAPWLVQIDRGEFEDALLNLTVNAMHAIGGTGELKLSTFNQALGAAAANEFGLPAGEYVLFSIDDNGAGMIPAVSARIFDPFYSTKGENGTGLGLSQVYGFVQRSRGTIRVDSSPTIGTRFDLYFPRCIAPEVELKRDKPNLDSNVQGTETILVVDDEPAIRDIFREILTEKGYKVICAEGGEQALNILKETSVDLLISDVIMSGMDGYQLARRVKLKFPKMKIQLVSGFSGDYQPDELDLNLQRKLLTKPVELRVLLERVRRLLDEKDV